MSLSQQAIAEVSMAHEFFNRFTKNLIEAHSTFAPSDGMMSTAQQVAHAAHTIDWFFEGAFRPEGFDMNFEDRAKIIGQVTSLTAARAWFEKAVARAKSILTTKSDTDLMAPLPPGPVMGGLPRMAIIGALADRTAHHRGALTVCARLNNIVPPMPYM